MYVCEYVKSKTQMRRRFWTSFSMTDTEVQNDPDPDSVTVDVCQPVMVVFCLVCFPQNTLTTVFIGLASRDFENIHPFFPPYIIF